MGTSKRGKSKMAKSKMAKKRTASMLPAVRKMSAKGAAKSVLGVKNTSSSHPDAVKMMLLLETASDERSLRFTLGNSTATMVTVTLMASAIDPGAPELVMVDRQSWDSRPRPKGRRIKAQIEIEGNPGAAATINVTNGEPQTITVEVPAGADTGWIHSRRVIASWK